MSRRSRRATSVLASLASAVILILTGSTQATAEVESPRCFAYCVASCGGGAWAECYNICGPEGVSSPTCGPSSYCHPSQRLLDCFSI